MATNRPAQDAQRAYKAHAEYAKKKAQWMALANVAINAWGSGERTLQQAVAEQMEVVWEMGRDGIIPSRNPAGAPVASVKRLTRGKPVKPPVKRLGRSRYATHR